ncbi:MAG: radical SAM protein [Nanoarchaeota archaeon]|nr:radical SAM protein [Nanoarchaeota archaeon]
MKIVLISIYGFQSHNVRNLASYLNANGHEADIIYFKDINYSTNIGVSPTDKEYGLLLKRIKELNPDILGISLFCCLYKGIFKEVLKRLRSTNLKLIIGGIAPTVSPEDYIDYADYLVRGEGEYPLLDLMNALGNGREPEGIKGVWYKKEGKVIENKERRLTDLNKLPSSLPSREKATYIDEDSYRKLTNINYAIITSRGCPHSCTYCANKYFWDFYRDCGHWFRKRTVESVIEELATVKKNTPELSYILIGDDNFLTNYKWLEQFCREYKEKINLPFRCLGTFVNCDEKTISLIKKTGCRVLGLGIQSGSERTRRDVFDRKMYTNEDIIRASRLLSKHKLFTRYDVITNNPFETKEDKEKTLQLILKLKKPLRLELFSLTFFPKNRITDMALEKGHITEKDIAGYEGKDHVHDWRIDIDIVTNKEDIYYGVMYQLVDSFIPRWIIRAIARTNFFKKFPELLKFSRYLRTLTHILQDIRNYGTLSFARSKKKES